MKNLSIFSGQFKTNYQTVNHSCLIDTNNGFLKNNYHSCQRYFKKILLVNVLIALVACGFQANAQCVGNLLQNPSFESPVVPNINANNIQPGTTITGGWTANATGGFNIIRVNGTNYTQGPNNASDGNQYIDGASANIIITQSFTLSSTATITYNGHFSNREAGNTFYEPWTGTVQILNSSNTVISTSNAVSFTTTVSDENWFLASGTINSLAPGTYTYRVNLGNFGHFDDALVCANTAPGYINVHKRTLDELSSVPFTFTGTGGISSFTLNDQPAQVPQNDLGTSASGRLYTTGAINNTLYYRDLGSATWVATSITNANRVDGGATNTCYFVTTAGTVSFFNGTTPTVIGDATDFGGSGAADVGSTWDNRPYVVAGGRIYRYSGSGTTWAQIGTSTDNIAVDGNPSNSNIVVCKTNQTVASITSAGVATNLGTPPATNTALDPADVGVEADGDIYACFPLLSNNQNTVFKWRGGTTWTEDPTGLGITNVTGGIGGQVWGIGVNGKTVNNGNIFTRSFNGSEILWIDDERVRTSLAGNSQMIAVAPGTYTITETEPAGWDLVQVVVADPSNNSTSNYTARTATVIVAAGESVNLTFENILLQSTAVTNSCTTTFTENFGTGATGTFGARLVGQTSYHYRNDATNAGDGNYKIVSQATDWATFAQASPIIYDHTSGNGTGRMMAVNASYERGDFFRRRFTGLIVGATYTFSGWFANLTSTSPIDPNITFAVTNPTTQAVIASANTGNIASAGVWEQTSLVFTATTTSVDLILTNNNLGGNGNDLALDDITFRLSPPSNLTATSTSTTCTVTTGSATVTAPVGAAYEYSRDGTTYQSSPTFSGLAPGNYTLYVRYVGSTNCVVTTTVIVRAAICGNVFNDPNGNAVKDAAEPFIINGSVWVNLVNPTTNDVIQSVQVQSDGTYSLTGVLPSTSYSIILSATNQTGNTNLTTATLPAGFVNTGVNLGGTANSGNNTGIITLNSGTANILNQNFAIEQLPTAGSGTNTATNPGGTTQISVPANTFTNTAASTDPTAAPNGVTGIRILGIPAGATSIVVNGTTYNSTNVAALTALTIPADANGNPTVAITVDPTATGNTTVTIQFRAVDAAGVASANIGNAVLNLTALITISGNVFDDPNGNAVKDATELFIINSSVWANLVNPTTNAVIQSVQVSGTGAYSFTGLAQNTSYKVILSTSSQTGNTNLTTAILPAGFVNTGVNLGGTANTANSTGIITLTTGTADLPNQNFAIEQLPTAGSGANTVANPGGTTQVSVPANTFTNTGNSTDPTASPNGVTGIRILGIPAGASSIVVNGVTYTSTNVGTLTALTIPADANGNPTVAISVDPTATGNTTVTIQFRAVDAAGELSANIGNAVLNAIGPITISGTVFDDANGLTDATVNGTGIGVLSGTQLYANLTNNNQTSVLAVVAVAANGTYTFNNVTASTGYTVRLSTNQGTVGAAPPAVAVPASWIITGENLGAGAGNDGSDGILGFTTGTVNVTNANFGVDARPVGTDKTLAAVANPGGTARVPIPASAFTATDLEDAPGGYANNLNGRTVTLDPNSGTGLLYYNGVQVNIAGETFTNFNTNLVTYDPAANGVTNGVFTYSVLDNAGVASVANTITVQFNDLTISGLVYNDPNTDATVNGTPANFVGSNTLYAILLNGTTIVSSQAIGSNGTTGAYSFGTANGVVAGTNYTVIISNSPTSITPALTGALNSSETDGTPNGSIAVTAGTASVINQNFGIAIAGYIYVHKRTLDESSSVDFTFTGSGGIGNIVLNDNPTQLGIKDIGSSASGRLYGVGTANNNLYYRDLGSSVWINTTVTGISKVDGGPATSCYLVTTGGSVLFYSGTGTTTTTIGAPANYGTSNAADIGAAWDTIPYVVTTAGLLYKYSGTGTTWTQVGTTNNNQRVDGFPIGNGCVVTRSNGQVYRITANNVETSLGFPIGANNASTDVAVDLAGNIYASYPSTGYSSRLVYRWTSGTSWTSAEVTSNVDFITAGIGGQVWGIESTSGSTASPYGNIYTRTVSGANIQWLDDERVRTSPANGNSRMIAVVPGTYTITETVPSGWYLKDVTIADPTTNSAASLGTQAATAVVAAGETVTPVFTNVLANTFPIINDCSSQYLENFGTGATGTFGAPLTGQTSYHYLGDATTAADGYYKVVSYSFDWANYGFGQPGVFDHTTNNGNGRFMAVNAAYDSLEFFRRRFTGLIVGATYNFNAYLLNLTPSTIKPNVSFIVQNPTDYSQVAKSSSGDITTTGVWTQYGLTFVASATTLDLSIVNNAVGGNGNDLALDDISFKLALPPGTLTTTSTNGSCSAAGSITVTAPLGAIYEYSINGTTFQASPTFTGVAAGTYVVTARYVGSTNCGLTAVVTLAPSICGNVFNDVNGNAVKDGTEPFITTGLFANLVDPATDDVIQSVPIQSDGSYAFNTLASGTAYRIILSTTSQTGNLNLTTATLPAGFANTGVNLNGTANTANQTGIINITATAANLLNQNFGIEALPIAGSGSNTATNQAGNAQVTVPTNTFTNTTLSSDPTPGAVTSIRITAFPTNATSIRIGDTTYTTLAALERRIIPTDANGNPTVVISVDPAADNTASVSIPFKARDAAGKESANTGTAVLNLLPLVSISGNVFNDVNGNAVKEVLEVITGGVYANLVDPTTNTVLQSVLVSAIGDYTFVNTTQNTSYKVILTNNSQAVNATLTASTLPAGFANTGVNLGGTANTGNQTGIITIATLGANLINQNFGIEALPVAGSGNNLATDPGGTAQVDVPANTFTNTTLSSDPTPGGVTGIRITTFPVGATSIRIGDTTYTTLAALERRIIPTDANGNPTVAISVDPILNNTPNVTIRFVARDAAGKESANTGTAVLNLLTPVSISGNVFNDVNGDAVQNGGEALITNGSVYANLVDPTTNNVIQSVVVSNTGTYTFATASQNTTYNIILTTTSQTGNTSLTAATLPAGFANTGVNLGGSANTGNQTGIISVTTVAANITLRNFGIESIPIAGGGSSSGTNLSGTLQVAVPASTFTNPTVSSDATLVTSIRITAFPAGVTSIRIGDTTYTTVAALTRLIIPTDASGNPTVAISVDPSATGATTITIPFVARDAAGKESANTGNAVLNLLAPVTISGNVFNDPNGNAVVDGGELFITDGSLYANLVNASNVVLQSVQLDATGSYTFTNASQNTAYKVVLTNNSQAINTTLLAATLPVGFVNTGVNVNGVANTAIQTGVISLTTGTTNTSAQNFAIEALPFAGSGTYTTTNPGGTLLINVPASTFTNTASSTDPAASPNGVTGIRITALPAGAASIVINGVTYNSGNLAALTNLTIPTDASGNPTVSIAVDPTNVGATTVSIPFRAVDAAGKLSANTGNAVITLLAPITITGNVFNDANGNAVKDGVDIFITDGTVFANLVDPSTNAVIQSVVVDASGNYTFGTVSQSTNYNIILSSSNQTGNTNLVASTLPAGFVNTGVNVNGTAITTNLTGIINLTTGTVNVTNVGFGIDALPVAGSGVSATTNLGGTTQLTIPATAFTSTQVSTDPVPGTVTGIRITAFPTGAASIVIDGISYTPADSAALKALIIPTDGNGNPTVPITVDPAIDGATNVVISFVARDAAGKESANTGTARLNLNAPVTISGSIFVDANGNAVKDGTEPFITNGSVYANLVNPATNAVLQSVVVDASGNYAFTGTTQNTSYKIILSTISQTGNTNLTTSSLPAGFVSTGVNLGGVANTGNQTGIVTVTTGVANLVAQNFAIERPPVTANYTAAGLSNPGGTGTILVPALAFTGTDAEDGTYATGLLGRTVLLTPGTGGTLFYNGVQVTAATTFTNFNPAQVRFDPAVNGATTGTFTYNVFDNANKPSVTAATVTLQFNDLLISGVVFDDPNADGIVNGTPAGTIGSNTMYALLVNGTTIVASQAVTAGGNYSFNNASGVVAGNNYRVVLSTSATVIAPTLTGAVYNSETDGSADGSIAITNITASITGQNFGIDRLPTVTSVTAASVNNPGGTIAVSVPVTVFTGSDPEDGTYPANLAGRKVALGAGVNGTLFYNGVQVQAGGITITGFDPALLSFDPLANGVTTGSFSFNVYDDADKPATTPATITLPFNDLLISGIVFNDGNATPAVDGTPAGVIGSNTLYAVLLDTIGNVVARVAVNPATGVYSFGNANGVTAGSTYTIVITNDSTITVPTLVGAVYNSETDGIIDGAIRVTAVSGNVIGQNFGIDRLPVVTSSTAISVANPGGTNTVPVPMALFNGTDAEDGTYTAGLSGRKVSLSPGVNGNLFYNGVLVTTDTIIASFNPALVGFDPNTGVATGTFNYIVYDNAGKPSSAPATITLQFSDLTISGTVFNDPNTTAAVDGTPTGTIGSNVLYVVLYNSTGGIVARKPVDPVTGTYSFGTADGVTSGSSYGIVLVNGSTATTPGLAAGSVYNSESDGFANGIDTIVNVTANRPNRNFGINQLPTVISTAMALQLNPGTNVRIPVPATLFAGSDPEDGSYTPNLAGRTVNLASGTNGSVYYGGVIVPTGAGTTIPNFDPTLVTFDPADGTVNATFTYNVFDNADKASATPATVAIPFRQGVTIAGTIWNDVNGDANNDLTEILLTVPTTMYANIVSTSGFVNQSIPVTGGTYTSALVFADSSYSVILTTTPQTPGSLLTIASVPTGWTSTGVNPGATTGTANTANRSGILPVSTAGVTTGVVARNFGIERIPIANNATTPAQANFAPYTQSVVATSFTGNDFDGGLVQFLRITAFPTNAETIVIGGITYTSSNFPLGGVTIIALPNGNPIPAISVKPNASVPFVNIPYVTVDNAGAVSAGAIVTIPYFVVLPVTGLDLIAMRNGNDVVLKWNTLTEQNTSHFIVERSYNGRTFETIGSMQASVNSNALKSYSIIDKNVVKDLVYYRITLLDKDGRKSVSNTVTVRLSGFVKNHRVFPNPVRDMINVELSKAGHYNITLYNWAGQQITTRLVDTNTSLITNISRNQLPAGTYVLKVQDAATKESEIFKLILE